MKQKEFLTYPIDKDNEGLIIANAIISQESRNLFVRKVGYEKFRTKEFQTVAWGIIETIKSGIEFNIDAVLLKSKTCPVRYTVDYTFIKNLIDNFDEVPLANFEEHIEQLSTDSAKHQMIDWITRSILPACTNPGSKMSDLEQRITYAKGIIDKGYSATKLNFKDMAQVEKEYDELKESGYDKRTTGFHQLDAHLTEGFKEGQITTIAGLSSMGKSSLALSIMKNLSHSEDPVPTAQFALEMNSMSLFTKLLAFKSRLPVNRVVRKPSELTPEELELYLFEKDKLAKNEYIFLNDTPMQDIASMREQIMLLQDRLQQQYIVVVIDLFGKIGDLQFSDNFARDYEKKLNQIQILVRELGIHMALVAQINKEVNKRKNKRPTMHDLKNSGALAEVSDIILGINRPYYDSELALRHRLTYGEFEEEEDQGGFTEDILESDENIAEVIILKQRMGQKDALINFTFDPETTCFYPITEGYQSILNQRKLSDAQ